jgi:hypothetical protein
MAGAGLTVAWMAVAAARQERLTQELLRQLGQLDESKLDRRYFESEEGLDLLRRVWKASHETRSKEKVSLYVRVLLQFAQGAEYGEGAEEYQTLIEEMSAAELAVADVMYRRFGDVSLFKTRYSQPRGKEEQVWDLEAIPKVDDLTGLLPDLDAPVIAQALKRLEAKGLVTEPMGMIIGYEGGSYYVTDYFRRMMRFLETNRLLFVPPDDTGSALRT